MLTITYSGRSATDLGYLLHKNPSRIHTTELAFGNAHVFYPEATTDRCTAALVMEIDPIGLVRNRCGPSGEGRSLEQYDHVWHMETLAGICKQSDGLLLATPYKQVGETDNEGAGAFCEE
jgi:hypothetical protein